MSNRARLALNNLKARLYFEHKFVIISLIFIFFLYILFFSVGFGDNRGVSFALGAGIACADFYLLGRSLRRVFVLSVSLFYAPAVLFRFLFASGLVVAAFYFYDVNAFWFCAGVLFEIILLVILAVFLGF